MRLRTLSIVVLAGFCLLCGGLVIQSGIFKTIHPASHRPSLPLLQQTTQVPAPNQPPAQAAAAPPAATQAPVSITPAKRHGALGGAEEHVTIGSTDSKSGYRFQLDLNSKGAAIQKATFSEFKNRDGKGQLTFLQPVQLSGGREIQSLANQQLGLVDRQQQLSLNLLSWRSLGVQTAADGNQAASFEATIVDPNDRPVLRLTKTFRVSHDTYLLKCALKIDNLTDSQEKVQHQISGPVGLEREDPRTDMRKVVAAFVSPEGQITAEQRDKKGLLNAQKKSGQSQFEPPKGGGGFRWIAAVNKYFAAILVPVPDGNDPYCKWVTGRTGTFYNPDNDEKTDSGDETVGIELSTATATLNPAGQEGNSRSYAFDLYLGPEDKSTFDKDPLYRQLGFVNTINFQGCCCPTSVINPLAFGILGIMRWMHGFWPHNYGIVIIVLVLLIRLVLHPITKMSQVSMSKMGKLAPKAEEIKKKYANDKQEQQKKMMELYRQQGASPIMGFLPMFLQMPIWIALWSSINTSVALRGAAFLPFWITDMSVPDALISWSTITIPYLEWHLSSLNLLPILMGVAFYFQQKLMPAQAAAATNPQMAQQQKMMNIMMPLLFPLMLYNGPSGVNLYIMSSTFAGVLEQQVIRKHIREKEEAEAKGLVPVTSKTGGKFKKKKPKPFFRS